MVNNAGTGKNVYGMTITIGDKNGSLCGVKVGMKKDTAVKKLEKTFGTKATAYDEFIEIPTDTNGYLSVILELKDNKITSISWEKA